MKAYPRSTPELYDLGFRKTERLTRLSKVRPETAVTRRDILELFDTFAEGHYSAVGNDSNVPRSLMEFGAWILGSQIADKETHWFEDLEPAQVVW